MSAIVVTGARGYIGTALAARLSESGKTMRLVSRAPVASEGWPDAVYVHADLMDEAAWRDLIAGAEAIIHLSWRTDLRAAESDPDEDEHINVEPVRALIRAAAQADHKVKVVLASTVTMAGLGDGTLVDESSPETIMAVYDRNKKKAETLLRKATADGVLDYCSLRLPNVYGYGRASVNANRGILNLMMRRATLGEPLTIYGDGSYVRDFTHLDDVVAAFTAAATTPGICDGSHYIIATGQGHSIADAFSIVAEEGFAATGRRAEVRHVPEPADLMPIERRDFVGNAALFQSKTGWRPRVGLRAGIRDWYVRHAAASQPAGALE